MKKTYNAPEIELIRFDAKDIITNSLTGSDPGVEDPFPEQQ